MFSTCVASNARFLKKTLETAVLTRRIRCGEVPSPRPSTPSYKCGGADAPVGCALFDGFACARRHCLLQLRLRGSAKNHRACLRRAANYALRALDQWRLGDARRRLPGAWLYAHVGPRR